MKRVLLTGMSGVGKSTVIRELARLGYKAIDLDEPGWSELVNVSSHPGLSTSATAQDWLWREDRIQGVLDLEDADVLFLSGCAPNQVKFYSRFDHIVLLSAPLTTLLERLATRDTNGFGKSPDELARVRADLASVEPRLRRIADYEIRTTQPLADVVTSVLRVVDAKRLAAQSRTSW
jgi:dephospho-CoA kinase